MQELKEKGHNCTIKSLNVAKNVATFVTLQREAEGAGPPVT